MISSQRKRHRFIWVMIGVLLPLLVVLAVLRTPSFPYSEKAEIVAETSLPILKEIESDLFKINLRGTSDGAEELELLLKVPLKSPSAVVFDDQQNVLGQIGASGVYRFPIRPANKAITIKDPIKNQIITEIKL